MSKNSIDKTGIVRITNMSYELFNDGLYYKEKAQNTDDFFIARRYRRSAIISFCSSTEAWINAIIKHELENKTSKLTEEEEILLNFMKNHNADIPKDFINIKRRLYNVVPKIIDDNSINWNNNKQQSFEDYIELSNMRNCVVHYAHKNSKDINSQKFINLIDNAPDIIENLFAKYESMGSKFKIPSWFQERKSRIIS